MTTYFKAVRHDYGSFRAPGFTYGPVGTVVEHPSPVMGSGDAADFLSMATQPEGCIGAVWKLDGQESRLLEVEPLGKVWAPNPKRPNVQSTTALRVVAEHPIHRIFGVNGEAVASFLSRLEQISQADADASERTFCIDPTDTQRVHDIYLDNLANVPVFSQVAATMHITATFKGSGYNFLNACTFAAVALMARDRLGERFDTLVTPFRALNLFEV